MKERRCRWKCGQMTDRRCGICLLCCNARDERNRRIDAGLESYVPPQDRPGHRLYLDSAKREARRERGQKARATRMANKQ